MKIREGFVLRKLPEMNLVMATGKNVKSFNGALMLNETGALIFECLQKGGTPEDAARELTAEYDVTESQALADVQKTAADLIEAGVADP